MRLKDILKDVKTTHPVSFKDVELLGITNHSKQAKEGFVFIALPGNKFDGHDFIKEAVERGAKAIVYNARYLEKAILEKKGIVFIQVQDIYGAVAQIAANFYHHPSSKINVVGVTGTNGKTTTTYLIESILRQAGIRAGVIGTINYRFGERVIPATHTTPAPLQLQELLHNMEKDNAQYAIMEVSSHGLQQRRTEGIDFKVGIFTNLSLDHLDYHQTFENYFKTKSMLFKNLSSNSWAIINIDDPYGRELLSQTEAKTITYAIEGAADVEARHLLFETNGCRFSLISPHGQIEIKTSLLGRHNIYNILAAVSFAISQEIELNLIQRGIEEIAYIPGRLEAIDVGQGFKVFVDYAHTDDALKNVLSSLRLLYQSKLILVFGCGGERCRDKRPLMGRVSSELADYVILTTDNPRSEEPEAIIKEIEQGFLPGFSHYQVILDRYAAIKEAIYLAQDHDVVVICGKGHEEFQIFKNTVLPFDDRKIAEKILLEKNLLKWQNSNSAIF